MSTTSEAPTAQPRGSAKLTRNDGRRLHFAGLEGVRALAAAMVVVHHAVGFAGVRRSEPLAELGAIGDMGVGIFFVLSGFLIYRPFARANMAGTDPRPVVSFWWRRLLRVVPAFWVVLTVFWIAGSYDLGSPSEVIRYYTFLQIYDSATALGGIPIAWSLNTEMSFYLMVPVWAWVLRRVLARGRTSVALEGGTLALLFAGGYVARQLFSHASDETRGLSFLWLPTNLDLFAGGMFLAVLHVWVNGDGRDTAAARWIRRVVGLPELWAAVFVLVFGWYAWAVGSVSFQVGYQGFFWHRRQFVILVLAMCLIAPLVFGERPNPVRWFWSWAPVAWMGTISYGLYLWHFGFIERFVDREPDFFGRNGWEGWAGTPAGDSNVWILLAAGFGLGTLLAAISWYLIEKPLQRFKNVL